MQKYPNKRAKMRAAGCMQSKNKPNKRSTDCDMETFQQQALEVRQPGEQFDPTVEPQTGEEYLMKMLYERKHCPAVVVKRPKQLKPKAPNVMNYVKTSAVAELNKELPSSLLPTPEWKAVQAADFLATREKIDLMRLELNAQNYSNEHEPPMTSEPLEWQQFCIQNPPLLSTILRINQRALEQLLDMICEWLREGADPSVDAEDQVSIAEEAKCESSKEEPEASSSAAAAAANAAKHSATALPFDLATNQKWLGSWLYAILACLHLPLEPDTHSTLRDIARICIRLRNRLTEQQLTNAVPYNLFIYIIAKVFDQLDLTEFV